MIIMIVHDGAAVVVRPGGRIDSHTSEALQHELLGQLMLGNTKLVLDLSGVDFMSSAGIRTLVSAHKAARAAHGDLRLSGVPENILQTLELTGMYGLLMVFDDVREAARSYDRQQG